ncbi:MAG: hypothetical protein COA68_12375 [Oceanobacter sp.]|nr:MAG: hypothetical protein COA68_12375 [Oceanobacter sp.]
MSASAFFHWRRGDIPTCDMIAEIQTLPKPALVVVHIRYHWVATRLSDEEWSVWDSAPSRAVRADLLRDSRRLGLPSPTFHSAPHQRHGSMECGLFAATFSMMLHAGYTIPSRPHPEHYTELSPLRKYVATGSSAAHLFLHDALTILGIKERAPTLWRHDPYKTKQPNASAVTPPEVLDCTAGAEPQDGQCTASTKHGSRCANPAVHDSLCRTHVLLANVRRDTKCSARPRNKACPHPAVYLSDKCAFHIDDAAFTSWLEALAQDVARQATTEPVAPAAIETPAPLANALEVLNDPDEENALLELMDDIPPWELAAPQDQHHSLARHLPSSAKLSDLVAHLRQPGSDGHPLARLAWNRTTLLGHLRALRAITENTVPRCLLNAPMIPALLEIISIKRKRNTWRWSTTIRAMAELAGALRNLPINKGLPAVILTNDPQWTAAIKGVAGKAKSERPRVPRAATIDEVTRALAAEPKAAVRRLLALTWCLCGRTGDVRQLTPEDVEWIQDASLGPNPLKVTFRRGKTISRRGPYTLNTVMPDQWLPLLGDIRNSTEWISDIKEASVPEVLKAIRRAHPSLENRSLRRGALQSLAKSPEMTDDILLSFSGHTNLCTLRRYLNWGSVDRAKEIAMTKAATASLATAAQHVEGGDSLPNNNNRATRPPTTMPLTPQNPLAEHLPPPPPYCPLPTYADHLIRGGQPPGGTTSTPYRRPRHPRNDLAPSGKTPERWLSFLGTEAPPTEELPTIQHTDRPDPATLPLMAKDVSGVIDTQKVLDLIRDPILMDLARSAFAWLTDTGPYEALLNNKRRSARHKANSTLQATDFETMTTLRKYEENPVEGDIVAWCRVFSVPEWSKVPPRRRHIAEPLLNDRFTATPTIHFLNRQQRHNIIREFGKGFALTMDLSSFFDQIALGREVRRYFGINAQGRTSRMRVLPMGFRPSAQIAQCVTWALVERAAALAGIKIISYLDNILILGRDADQVKLARQMIIDNADTTGAIFNSEGLSDEPSHQFTFLGEDFDLTNTIVTSRASTKTIDKLNALDVDLIFPEPQSARPISKRQLAAVVGLCLFADGSGLDRNDIYERFHALRHYGEQTAARGPHLVDWDAPCSQPSPLARDSFRNWIAALRRNTPRPLYNGTDESDHPHAILYVDASEERWAYVLWNREDSSIRTHAELWTAEDKTRWNLGSSVSSEPLGACRSLCHAIPLTATRHRAMHGPDRVTRHVHLYTDHAPLIHAVPSVCARTYTYWRLQKLCREFRAMGTMITLRHIPGIKNPADPGSRGISKTDVEWNLLLQDAKQHALDTEDGEYGKRVNDAETGPEWASTARNPTRALHFVAEHPA